MVLDGNQGRFIQTIKSQIQVLREKYSYIESKLMFITRHNTFQWIHKDLFDYKEEKKNLTTKSFMFTKTSKRY